MLQNFKTRTLALFAGTAFAAATGVMFVGAATAQKQGTNQDWVRHGADWSARRATASKHCLA